VTDDTDADKIDREIVAVDLFCGAGGFSEGLRQACDRLGYGLRHAAINHWKPAIETHECNHPNAHQYHSKVEQLHPPEVIDGLVDEDVSDVHAADASVDILVAGPECTHFSSARGGKPVSEQKRMSPWQVLDWLEKLNVDAFIIENVNEIQSWGPVDDGEPTRDGTIFEAWINALNQLGYSVEWTTLEASEFGDPTSRERFFLVGRQSGKATFPEPTHGDDPNKPNRRRAAEIINWSDLGGSIWTRDLTHKRVHSPPKDTTMQRIAEGIRRHCDDRLAPFADILENLGRDEIRTLRQERLVPAEDAHIVADAVDEPFLVRTPRGGTALSTPYLLGQHSNSIPRHVAERPIPTVAGRGNIHLCTADSILLRQQDGGSPWSVSERSVPTIPTKGGHAIATPSLVMPKNYPQRGIHSNTLYEADSRPFHTVTSDPRAKLVSPSLIRWFHGGATLNINDPMLTIAAERSGVWASSRSYLTPLYNGRAGQRPRSRSVNRPLMTVPASKQPAAVTTPQITAFLDDYEGPPAGVGNSLGTITTRDRFALVVPELWPWGLDIRYRMLQPDELKQAQGFPAEYEIVGSKAERTKQIGNAVPVNLARKLCEHVLTSEDPSLASYGGGFTADDEADIPSYGEVSANDD